MDRQEAVIAAAAKCRKIACAAVALAIAPALQAAPRSAAATRTVQATAAQLLRFAEAALERGDEQVARGAYRALSNDIDPNIRLEARFRLAMLEGRKGNLATAASQLREIIDERPGAAPVRLELAGLLDKMGDKEGAWRQLRAIHAAGLPPDVARLIDRYSQALRAQRPFGANFEFAVAPDSNINRATRSDTLGTIFGDFQIADEGKARSGTGIALNSQAYRRFALSPNANLLVRMSGFASLYQQSEFNDLGADLAAGPELTLGRNRLHIEAGATQRWFGQKPFMRAARISANLTHPMGGRTVLRLSGSAAVVDNRLNDLQDGKAYSGQIAMERALSPTMGVIAGAAVDRQSLGDAGYSTIAWRGSLTGWHDMGRVTLSAGIEFGRLRADERLLLFPLKRSDRYTRLNFGATFRQIQWHGFAPIARLSIERNRSTIAFYDYRRTRTEIGIVRAF